MEIINFKSTWTPFNHCYSHIEGVKKNPLMKKSRLSMLHLMLKPMPVSIALPFTRKLCSVIKSILN